MQPRIVLLPEVWYLGQNRFTNVNEIRVLAILCPIDHLVILQHSNAVSQQHRECGLTVRMNTLRYECLTRIFAKIIQHYLLPSGVLIHERGNIIHISFHCNPGIFLFVVFAEFFKCVSNIHWLHLNKEINL